MHFETYVDPVEVSFRLGAAVVFGLLLGLDREVRGHDAGVRTHMLVALGAAVMTIIAFELFDALQARHRDAAGDPLRVIEGVVTAVGFLGAEAMTVAIVTGMYLIKRWVVSEVAQTQTGSPYTSANETRSRQ